MKDYRKEIRNILEEQIDPDEEVLITTLQDQLLALISKAHEEKDQEIAVFEEGFMSSYCFHHKLNSESCDECGRAMVGIK